MKEMKKEGKETLTTRYFTFLTSKADKFASAILSYVTWDANTFPMTLQFHWKVLLSYADMLGFTLVKEYYEEERSEHLNFYSVPLLEQRTGICMELMLATYGYMPQDKDKIMFEVAFEVMGLNQEGIHYQYAYMIPQNQMLRVIQRTDY